MSRRQLPAWQVWSGAILAGLASWAVLGGKAGVLAGLLAVLPARRALAKLEPAAGRRERQRAARDLPYLADLLAAALRSGLPLDRAVQLVAEAVPGPAGDRLARVARSVALGLAPGPAWAALGDVPGGARMASAVVRSAHSGAALANAFARIADDLRAGRTSAAEAAARRSGVLIVLPLGLCFLPAFVFAGVVPVIVAVLGDVLR